jgi:prepilin-type N-terminal cleavage/methylation domain-containing protein
MARKFFRAVTLIELMITLAIVVIVLSLAIATMRGYIPKQKLITSSGILETCLQRAQTEANSRSYWTCIKFNSTPGNPISAEVRVDKEGKHGNGTANPCTGPLLQTCQFKSDIIIPPPTGKCARNMNVNDCIIWFDSTGSPNVCSNSGNCGGEISAITAGCVPAGYQIVLSNPNLDAGAKAREVEALVGGLIQTVKPSEKGLDSYFYARGTGDTNTGCE